MDQSQSKSSYGQAQSTLDQITAMLQGKPASSQDVYRNLAGRVDNFAPQYQELRGLESQAYAAPATLMNDFYNQYGKGGSYTGPSAIQALQGILSNLGDRYGTIDSLRGSIDTQKGRLQDLANSSYEQYNQEGRNLAQLYGMQMQNAQQQYQQEYDAWQRDIEERKLAQARAGGGGGGGWNMPDFGAVLGSLTGSSPIVARGTASRGPIQGPTVPNADYFKKADNRQAASGFGKQIYSGANRVSPGLGNSLLSLAGRFSNTNLGSSILRPFI